LVQVFLNVLENAVLHSAADGEVTVEARSLSGPDEDHVVCLIRDAGTGFDPAELPQVFEPFYTRRQGGVGLGLSIAWRIVREHGGCITAANHPSGGAVVSIRLPVG
jgi:signal transduction histidine kinase